MTIDASPRTPVAALDRLAPAAEQAWITLFDLADFDPDGWCLLGGQMMYLLAAEGGRQLPRTTDDADVCVDVRAWPDGTERLSAWLIERGFRLAGVSPEGIGHRFERQATPGPGTVIVDVLAAEALGECANTYTSRPARTVSAPATRQAFARSQLVPVSVSDVAGTRSTTGWVRRPSLLGALVCKAAATQIPVRENPDRDWQDAALALSMLADPIEAAEACTKSDRRHLRALAPLADDRHGAWLVLPERDRSHGVAALAFLLQTPSSPSNAGSGERSRPLKAMGGEVVRVSETPSRGPSRPARWTRRQEVGPER